MGYSSMKVLACVRSILKEMPGTADKEATMKLAERCRASEEELIGVYSKIYHDVTEGIADQFSESVDVLELGNYIDVPDKSVFLPGFLYPEELLQEAEAWNREIEDGFLAVLGDLREEMEKYASPREFVAGIADYSENCRNKDIANRLRHVADDLCGEFVFGGTRLVMNEYGCWDFNTGIRPEMMEEIRENPENYAILLIAYD